MAGLPKAIFVRHAASTGNRAWVMKGVADYPLDAAGRREAKRVAKTIVRHKPTVVVTSPLQRAKVLAEEVAKQGKIPLHVDKTFLPQDLGKWQGKPMESHEPKLSELARRHPDEPVPGGESFNHFLKKKVKPGFKKVQKMVRRGERHVIVTHSRNLREMGYGLGKGAPSDPTRGGPKTGRFVVMGKGDKLSAGT